MNPVFIESVSLLGPGLPDWQAAQAILQNEESYAFSPTLPVNCAFLTPNIKRRTSLHMHIALQAAEKVLGQSDVNPADVELLFASAEGDLHIADEIFIALTQPEKLVSPQKFQNVILNAAVGHLGIILGNTSSATSVTGGEYSFAVGLLQAAISVAMEERHVLFVSYDALGPEHLDARVPGGQPFSVGFLLSPVRTPRSIASLTVQLEEGEHETRMIQAALEAVRVSVGAARALPLLAMLAGESGGDLQLPYCENSHLKVELAPCLQ